MPILSQAERSCSNRAGVAEGVLQNHNFERALILYQDFLRVYTQVFIDIQIYRDSAAYFDGFYDGQAGKTADAYFIAGIYIEGFEQYEQRVPAESKCPGSRSVRKPGESFFVFVSKIFSQPR